MFGVHINDNPKEISFELDRIKDMGCSVAQLFVDPNVKNKFVYDIFKKKLHNNKMRCVVHASYTINIAKDWDEYSPWIIQFIEELELAYNIDAFGIVIHCGKQLNLTKEQALNNMFTALLYVHNKTKNYSNVKIILETPSGQGSETLFKIEDLAYFFKKFSLHRNENIRDRFKICIDTCHIFQSGYDIRTNGTINMYLDTFEELIGLKNIALIHLNDSKNELGMNVDRHENLGKGYIGAKGLKIFAEFFKKYSVPIILETSPCCHTEEIKIFLK